MTTTLDFGVHQPAATFDHSPKAPAAVVNVATGPAIHGVNRTKVPTAVAQRKLEMLRRSGMFSGDTNGAVIERARSYEDLRDAYRLVHDVYVESGYIKPESGAIRLRIFETSSETATFVAKKEGRVVGVLSVAGDSVLGLPSDLAFKSELNALRSTGVRVCELTNQAVAEEFRRGPVAMELMRSAVAHCLTVGYHCAVASVSPSHMGFYALAGFLKIGSERSYSSKVHDPVVALCLNLQEYRRPAPDLEPAEQFVHSLLADQNVYIDRVEAWDTEAKARFLKAELLARLFAGRRNFLSECSAFELQILRRHWGPELFEAVLETSEIAVRRTRPERILTQASAQTVAA